MSAKGASRKTAKGGKGPPLTPKSLMKTLQMKYATRFHMFLIVAASVSVALLVTRFLLAVGVEMMWVRYLAALGFAYATFFFGVYVWLLLSPYGQHLRRADFVGDVGSLPDVPLPVSSAVSTPSDALSAGGGDFGGGGASGGWGADAVNIDVSAASASVDTPDVGGLSDLSLDGGDDGCGIVIVGILVVALLAVLFGASIYVIYQAPAILAEVVFEVLLGSPLARGARAIDTRHWSSALLRKTWIPFAILCTAAMAFAIFVQMAFPEVHTAGEAWRLFLTSP